MFSFPSPTVFQQDTSDNVLFKAKYFLDRNCTDPVDLAAVQDFLNNDAMAVTNYKRMKDEYERCLEAGKHFENRTP